MGDARLPARFTPPSPCRSSWALALPGVRGHPRWAGNAAAGPARVACALPLPQAFPGLCPEAPPLGFGRGRLRSRRADGPFPGTPAPGYIQAPILPGTVPRTAPRGPGHGATGSDAFPGLEAPVPRLSLPVAPVPRARAPLRRLERAYGTRVPGAQASGWSQDRRSQRGACPRRGRSRPCPRPQGGALGSRPPLSLPWARRRIPSLPGPVS